MKNINVKTIAKLIVTSLFLYLITKKVNIGDIFLTLSNVSLPYIFILLSIHIIMVAISCLKWQIFLRARGTDISIPTLMVYYYIGYFFNNLLPSSIGGDVARIYLLGKNLNDHTKSISTVFLERYTGLIALIVLTIVAGSLNSRLAFQSAIKFPIFVMSLILIGSLIFFSFERIKNLIFDLLNFDFLSSIKRKFDGFYQSVHYFRNQWKILAYSMIYSFIFHVMTIINTLASCWAINISPNVYDLAVTVPIILFVSMAPITIGSIGLWEGAFGFFLLQIGIPLENGIAVALILRAVSILLGLLGGVFYLLRGKLLKHPHSPETNATTADLSDTLE
jgi:hypothetical protein